jgi:PAS domain S-box-containing protein
VARIVAVSVESALNAEWSAAQQQRTELQRSQQATLLEITNTLVAARGLDAVLRNVSACLHRVVKHDAASLNLYDAATGNYNVMSLDERRSGESIVRFVDHPIEGSAFYELIESGQPLVREVLDAEEFPNDATVARVVAHGFVSICSLPMLAQGRVIGVLGIGRRHREAFTAEEVAFLSQVATQLVLAIENAMALDKIQALKEELTEENQRLVEAIRAVQRFDEVVGDNAVLRTQEGRLRDLFDEAPIAYVKHDFETRFLSANRAAMDILGIRPNEVEGLVGRTLIPDTPEAQRLFKETMAALHSGGDAGGHRLEMRRKDDGRLICVQWWSKPDPSGRFARTMFIDITEQVLLEQEQVHLKAHNLYLREEIKSGGNFDEIIGHSAALRQVLDQVGIVAATESTVLIEGESGTGKELIARAIHDRSPRRDRPLIKVNCAAIPLGLIESELFGHEKGAFTGAISQRRGKFEMANGGTIFLDEIGDMPRDMQAKLLRVLQEREIERVGGSTTIALDVRVIVATHVDLQKKVLENEFRADLYYRLNVFPLRLPPLRERRGDIGLLVNWFTQKLSRAMRKKIDSVPLVTMQALEAYAWPGNIRELQNVIERSVILTQGTALDVPLAALAPAAAAVSPSGDDAMEAVEREHMVRVLAECRWVLSGPAGAAARLGLKRTTLQSRMKRLGVVKPDR